MGDLFILVVSNDNNFRDYLSNYLLMDGHCVDTADQFNIARQMLHRMNYDLILMSLNGFENKPDALTAEEIQDLNPNSEVVFLFNPNCDMEKQFMPCRKSVSCLLEPFLLEDLPAVLRKAANRKVELLPKDEIQKRPIERRKSFRVLTDIPIKYTFITPWGNMPSEENVSKIINMSIDGVMFKADFKSKLAEFVYLYILFPSSNVPINTQGEIKWERFNSTEPWRYIGVRFTNLNQEDKKEIEYYINSRRH